MDMMHELKGMAKRTAQRAVVPLVGGCLVWYFAYHAIVGERGLHAMLRINEEISKAEATLATLQTQREKMERRANSLRPDSLDPDMLDERARDSLNYSGPNDVIIRLPDAPPATPTPRSTAR